MKKTIIGFSFLIFPAMLFAQYNLVHDTIKKSTTQELKFSTKQLIVPTILFMYGIVAIESDYLKLINTELRNELKENIDEKITIDDFTQYLPAASVYLLNNVGIAGKHNLKD